MHEVTLNEVEFYQAINIGVIRQMKNVLRGRKDRFGAEKMDPWGIHIQGACGEAAVAKHLNIFYNGNIGNLSACDVNNNTLNLQVRTGLRYNGDLILHKSDKDNNIFILVCGKAPIFRIMGWIKGMDGKKEKYWRDPAGNRPAYFVPQTVLKPMETLQI